MAVSIQINGIVQGVGFRPFVFQLAEKHSIAGTVSNTSSGVKIYAEGLSENITNFSVEIVENRPVLSTIYDIVSNKTDPQYFKNFMIIKSEKADSVKTLISPDVSICEDCREEMSNPENRRYLYPFINCTNCGPRYSIISGIPYDRQKTSMKDFTLCPDCLKEYNDPLDRRFHAQPNACYKCGPEVMLFDSGKNKIVSDNCIEKAASLLKEGYCLAVKGIGGFHLAVDATNAESIKKLRQLKNRGDKPFAVMADSIESIKSFADVSDREKRLLNSFQKPVVLLRKKKKASIDNGLRLNDVSPANNTIGVMLPYTPLHYLLLSYGLKTLVMTSANKRSEPIVIDNDDAFETLSDFADFFLVNNRDIYLRGDDSVIKNNNDDILFLRRSRGYAPSPILLHKSYPEVIALGGEQKNTVCLLRDDKALMSHYVGDLDNPKAHDFFKMTIDHLKRIFEIEPKIVAHDLHPDYLSTIEAEKTLGVTTVAVQHHHAHIVSCMAENNVADQVIGLAFDGTGYGDDGTFWGSEVLIADATKYKRAAHLSTFPMPGGDAAIREPWRIGLSLLYKAFGDNFPENNIPLFERFNISKEKTDLVKQMIDKGINSPETSGMGRLFDGISAIIGIRGQISYEGQAAIDLEMAVEENDNLSCYDYSWKGGDVLIADTSSIVKGVVGDLVKNEKTAVISRKFHNTVINLFSDICDSIRDTTGLNTIALSGGVFQNEILLNGFFKRLEGMGFEVYSHKQVPTNDGGLALGQALIAAEAERSDNVDGCVTHHLT